MIFLAEFSVITPEIGLLFWTSVIFLVVWFFLGKSAFGPIAKALKKREESIENALQAAEKARTEMAALTAKNEALAKEAHEERAKILAEAKTAKAEMIEQARQEAKDEAARMIAGATAEIDRQKRAAITEIKNQVAAAALEIAEKVIQKELSKDGAQQEYVNGLVDGIKLN